MRSICHLSGSDSAAAVVGRSLVMARLWCQLWPVSVAVLCFTRWLVGQARAFPHPAEQHPGALNLSPIRDTLFRGAVSPSSPLRFQFSSTPNHFVLLRVNDSSLALTLLEEPSHNELQRGETSSGWLYILVQPKDKETQGTQPQPGSTITTDTTSQSNSVSSKTATKTTFSGAVGEAGGQPATATYNLQLRHPLDVAVSPTRHGGPSHDGASETPSASSGQPSASFRMEGYRGALLSFGTAVQDTLARGRAMYYGVTVKQSDLPVRITVQPGDDHRQMDVDLFVFHETDPFRFFRPNGRNKNHFLNFKEEAFIPTHMPAGLYLLEIFAPTDTGFADNTFNLIVERRCE